MCSDHATSRTSAALVRALVGRVLDALIPCHCLHCLAIEPGSMALGLCSSCRRRLEPIESGGRVACELCGQALPGRRAGASVRCLPCRRRRTPIDRLFAAWRYQAPLDAVIHGLKFKNMPYLGSHLGRGLSARLPADLAVDAVVPVPLHWRRARSRGYNQAAEIAGGLARARGWSVDPVLARRRATPPQTGLDRARRRRNPGQAFVVRTGSGRLEPRGRRLLLVDDVYTTGATVEAAAGALKAAGAAWVGAAVAGRTPEPARSPLGRDGHL